MYYINVVCVFASSWWLCLHFILCSVSYGHAIKLVQVHNYCRHDFFILMSDHALQDTAQRKGERNRRSRGKAREG